MNIPRIFPYLQLDLMYKFLIRNTADLSPLASHHQALRSAMADNVQTTNGNLTADDYAALRYTRIRSKMVLPVPDWR